ncbi:adenine phosphoribosyltransferase-like [Clavelina lepadiformis]|uniref:Adenine phosphoribosyltransferase n=1 Tax=Clavelina lepadiformis TaxID=159417 RepID=A0ABP0GZP9_CLALP
MSETSVNPQDIVTGVKNRIRVYPDFPKKGILFYDIFPLFQTPSLLNDVVRLFVQRLQPSDTSNEQQAIDVVVGLDSRGFLFGPSLANHLDASFVPIRKKGKLPGEKYSVSYSLEYGVDALEIQADSIKSGQRVVIVDDLMATGGTMSAACKLVQQLGGIIKECQCVIELTGLKGVEKLPDGVPSYSIVQYEF